MVGEKARGGRLKIILYWARDESGIRAHSDRDGHIIMGRRIGWPTNKKRSDYVGFTSLHYLHDRLCPFLMIGQSTPSRTMEEGIFYQKGLLTY